VKRSHSRTSSGRPLFRGYLFVHVTNDLERWRPLLSTYGVRSVVRFGSRLGFVDTAFIDSLRAREIDGAIGHSKQVYSVGQDVQIVTGPFDGAITRIIEMNDRDRLIVLMNVLGGSVRVMLDTAQVQPARLQDPSGPLVA
jgi:transcription antitermination factor NusG